MNGKPLQRPGWYYDTDQQGEAIVDVTTHLVDLVQWETFPGETLSFSDELVICPKCHEETFVEMQNGNNKCINCGYDIDISKSLMMKSRIEDLKKEMEQNTDNE